MWNTCGSIAFYCPGSEAAAALAAAPCGIYINEIPSSERVMSFPERRGRGVGLLVSTYGFESLREEGEAGVEVVVQEETPGAFPIRVSKP